MSCNNNVNIYSRKINIGGYKRCVIKRLVIIVVNVIKQNVLRVSDNKLQGVLITLTVSTVILLLFIVFRTWENIFEFLKMFISSGFILLPYGIDKRHFNHTYRRK